MKTDSKQDHNSTAASQEMIYKSLSRKMSPKSVQKLQSSFGPQPSHSAWYQNPWACLHTSSRGRCDDLPQTQTEQASRKSLAAAEIVGHLKWGLSRALNEWPHCNAWVQIWSGTSWWIKSLLYALLYLPLGTSSLTIRWGNCLNWDFLLGRWELSGYRVQFDVLWPWWVSPCKIKSSEKQWTSSPLRV